MLCVALARRCLINPIWAIRLPVLVRLGGFDWGQNAASGLERTSNLSTAKARFELPNLNGRRMMYRGILNGSQYDCDGFA